MELSCFGEWVLGVLSVGCFMRSFMFISGDGFWSFPLFRSVLFFFN